MRLRLMALGRPKSGKTPLLAQAANAGFRVGLLDYDGNGTNILPFLSPEARDRVSIVTLRDRLFARPDGTRSPLGPANARREPRAWLAGARALDDWGKLAPEHPWGAASTWGEDTVLAFDSLTGAGDAAWNQMLFNNNRDVGRIRRQDWSSAMQLEDSLLEDLVGPYYKCHLFVTAHLKLIGPKTEDDQQDDDDDLKTAKHAIAAAQAAALPTRYYPTALGRALPQEILRRVPASVLVENTDARRVWTRPPVVDGVPMPIDIGVPGMLSGKILPASLNYDTAFLDILEAVCGYRKPPKQEEEKGE